MHCDPLFLQQSFQALQLFPFPGFRFPAILHDYLAGARQKEPQLQECDCKTIIAGALLGESLNLSPSPQLGQYYLVPFKDKKAGTSKATFILGLA